MEKKIIRKTKKILKKTPNLIDYDQTYRFFSWSKAKKKIPWFSSSKLNIARVILNQQVQKNKSKIALYWQGKEGKKEKYTFGELNQLANRFACFLKELEVKPGDRVFFFLPRLPLLYYGFLGVLKLGAVAGTLFAAFGPQALLDRLKNSGAKVLITTKELKKRVDKISNQLPKLEKVIVVDHRTNFFEKQVVVEKKKTRVTVETKTEEPAFMLYTSGTTGKPKGIVHSHQTVLLAYLTAQWVLDLQENDVFWCTADPGWITGIVYGILGPWSNGVTSLVYEGRFEPERWYQLIQDYRVNIWYTAPTAIRMLAAVGRSLAQKYDLSSLRHLASVGEPLNPEAIFWSLKTFGLPFHDTWWQTETGGILIANYPCLDIKPGSMGKPVPGITAAIVDDRGNKLGVNQVGNLAIKPPWPSMMKKIWRRPKKYQSYFLNGWYISGDLAYQDKDGYFWFVSRADDVIKTAGERVGPFEVESALISHPAVVEAAVIGKPDPIRGEIIKAFIKLKPRYKESKDLKEKIKLFVKKELAGHAYPREIEFVKKLPKTRSGKIVRRLLKAKELGLPLGDVSALEE